MLPPSQFQCYEEFKRILEEARDTTSQDTVDRGVLQRSVAKIEHYFQNQILTLDVDGLDVAAQQQVRSVQVEIDKQLRLLKLDEAFLRVAKQTSTLMERSQQMSRRLMLLVQYCDVLLKT